MLTTTELVERYINLNNNNDVEGVVDCCADDVMFESVVNPNNSVRLQGKDKVREILAGTMQAFSQRNHRIASLIVDGERAAAETLFVGVAAADLGGGVNAGDEVSIRGATIFEARDGKIVRICDYS